MTQSFDWGLHEAAVDAALAGMAQQRIIARIWAHDHTVWKPDPAEITNRLGWLDIAGRMKDTLGDLAAFVDEVRAAGFTQVVLFGMGGSSLAPDVFRQVFGRAEGYLDLEVLDSTDPGAVLSCAERLDLTRTLFIVSTKSGGTVETLSLFKYFYNRVSEILGASRAGSSFVAITDPGSGLDDLARRYRFRATFRNDPAVGGRYSALSYVGLVPAALLGIDITRLLDRAVEMAALCRADDSPAARLGAGLGVLAQAGCDKLTLVLSPPIASLGDWIEQLVAESTGKEGKGILPVVGEAVGEPGVYGRDRLFGYLRLAGDTTHDAAVLALHEAGFPVVRFDLADGFDLGAQMFLWKLATAVASHHLGINPFDQPDVEAAKVLARQMVAAYAEQGSLPAEPPALRDGGITVYGETAAANAPDALRTFLAQGRPGDYVALQAYLEPAPEVDVLLRDFQTRIRDHTSLAVTLGYGPRFLHSTGQLHKGDAGRGLFIQFTVRDVRDAAIPDEAGEPASGISFGVLKASQALGDRQALLDSGRRVLRFDLGHDALGELSRLVGVLG